MDLIPVTGMNCQKLSLEDNDRFDHIFGVWLVLPSCEKTVNIEQLCKEGRWMAKLANPKIAQDVYIFAHHVAWSQ